jgi:phosphoadenosine phosphosulfate reductase
MGEPVSEMETRVWAALLERRSASDALAWAAERFEARVGFATGFGAEGCVLIHLIAEQRLPIDIFTLDTGLLFPETYELWRRLESRYDVRIRAVRPSLTVEEQAAVHGGALWAREPDRCCEMRKVQPLSSEVRGLDAWITAIRRDQTRDRAHAPVVGRDERFGLVKVNPLARWTRADVWRFLREHDVPYNPLHDRGYPSIGCEPCTSAAGEDEDPRAGRWRGRGKTECGLHRAPAVEARPVVFFSAASRESA